MDASQLPALVLMVLPGFVAIQVFNLVSHKRRLSDLEGLLSMLLVAFVLLAPTVAVWHRLTAEVPSLGTIVRRPEALPLRLAAVLYVLALPLGWSLGRLDRSTMFEAAALKLGVDLRRRQDVWSLAFRDCYYVMVYLRSGTLLYGWPGTSSTTRAGEPAQLFLTNTEVWDIDAQSWRPQGDLAGIWIDADEIERIEFTKEGASVTAARSDAER